MYTPGGGFGNPGNQLGFEESHTSQGLSLDGVGEGVGEGGNGEGVGFGVGVGVGVADTIFGGGVARGKVMDSGSGGFSIGKGSTIAIFFCSFSGLLILLVSSLKSSSTLSSSSTVMSLQGSTPSMSYSM